MTIGLIIAPAARPRALLLPETTEISRTTYSIVENSVPVKLDAILAVRELPNAKVEVVGSDADHERAESATVMVPLVSVQLGRTDQLLSTHLWRAFISNHRGSN